MPDTTTTLTAERTPNESDIAMAKAWAASQDPPVTVGDYIGPTTWSVMEPPEWLDYDTYGKGNSHPTADAAWLALATALKPVIASVRPVIEAEALRRAAALIRSACGVEKSVLAEKVEALIPAKGAALITPQPETPK